MNGNFRAAVALALGLVLASAIWSWAFLAGKKLDERVKVTGSAKMRIKSDLIVWRTSVTSEAASLADAYAKLSRDLEKARTFLTSHGVAANHIVTSAVATTPIRRGARAGSDSEYGGSGENLSGPITGYHLKQSLELRSTEIDKIAAVSRQITELVNQGILLESEEPQYLYTKLADVKVEILATAAKDALARAQQIASSTGSRVGEVRSADMGVLQITAADSTEISGYGMNDTKSLEKDITAVVHLTFALK